jgi:hypothetical protein
MHQSDLDQIVSYCRNNLDLRNARLADEYSYRSLPLCVIDAIFSIGARTQSTDLTVKRFCAFFGLERLSLVRDPDPASQLSISEFLAIYNRMGIQAMANQVYQNRQRTSTRNGILKADAVWRAALLLHGHGVEVLQDVDRIIGERDFEAKFQAIPGQASGISLRYFYMLAGSDDYVKPDRMISRFIRSATNKNLSVEEMHQAIVSAVKILSAEYPHLTPRLLDNLIWNYQGQR